MLKAYVKRRMTPRQTMMAKKKRELNSLEWKITQLFKLKMFFSGIK